MEERPIQDFVTVVGGFLHHAINGVPHLALENSVIISAITVSFMTFMVPSLTSIYRLSTMVGCFGFCLLVLRYGARGVLSCLGTVAIVLTIYGSLTYREPLVSRSFWVEWDADTDHLSLEGTMQNFSEGRAIIDFDISVILPRRCDPDTAVGAYARRTYSTSIEVAPSDDSVREHFSRDLGHLAYVEGCITSHDDAYVRADIRTHDSRDPFGSWFTRSLALFTCFYDQHTEVSTSGSECRVPML